MVGSNPEGHSPKWWRRHSRTLSEPTRNANGAIAPEETLHPILRYVFRTMGIASLVFAGAGLISGISFTLFSVFTYIGLFILGCDSWLEPSLRKFTVAKVVIGCRRKLPYL
jgi:hypothetical protein